MPELQPISDLQTLKNDIKPELIPLKTRTKPQTRPYPKHKAPLVIADLISLENQPISAIMTKHNLTYRQIQGIKEDNRDKIDELVNAIVRDSYFSLKKMSFKAVETLRKLMRSTSDKIKLSAAERVLQIVFDKQAGFQGDRSIPRLVINMAGNSTVSIGGMSDKDLSKDKPVSNSISTIIDSEGVETVDGDSDDSQTSKRQIDGNGMGRIGILTASDIPIPSSDDIGISNSDTAQGQDSIEDIGSDPHAGQRNDSEAMAPESRSSDIINENTDVSGSEKGGGDDCEREVKG